jgi:23S rRNA G2445 N2-methylase RlmL
LRFVDVIPAAQATIILPEEFTKITGSDFDIDHLYLASYNYNTAMSEDGIEYTTTTFNPVEDEGKNLDKYN